MYSECRYVYSECRYVYSECRYVYSECVCVFMHFLSMQFCYFLPSVAIALLYVFLFCLLAPLCFNPFFVVPGSVL